MPSADSLRGNAKACATAGWVRWKAVSKQPTCGTCGISPATARTARRLCGWCSGASGTKVSSVRSTDSSSRVGAL